MNSRTERIIGKEKLNKILNSNIAILGVGGVGGYVVEMLARTGVNNLTIVDFDKIDVSNLNRQIISLQSNIGHYKTTALKNRILDINPNCQIKEKNIKISKENIKEILNEKYDFVIDAIDDVNAKIAIAKYCEDNNIKLISSMGTGNRYKEIPNFEVCDISKTSYDKLAKKIRKMLKEENVKNLTVVYSKQPCEQTDQLGSIVYYPLMCAGTIVSYVVNKIIE